MDEPTLHGNDARIDPKKKVIPRFVTSSLISKETQTGNQVPDPSLEDTILAKTEVDENHK